MAGLTLNSRPKRKPNEPFGTLEATEPSLRDNIAHALAGWIGGDNKTRYNYVKDKVGGGVDFVPGVGDAVGFDDAKRDFDAGNYGSAALNAGASTIGLVPGAGDLLGAGLKAGAHHLPDALALIIGPRAANWDWVRNNKAIDMSGDGQSPERIWEETQTYYDPINYGWRQEVADKQSRLKAETMRDGLSQDFRSPDMLDDVIDHGAAFEAYPGLRDVGVVQEDAMSAMYGRPSNALGGLHKIPSRISNMVDGGLPDYMLSLRTPDFPTGVDYIDKEIAPKSTALHEMQHWIQNFEGWTHGSNVDAVKSLFGSEGTLPDTMLRQAMSKRMAQLGLDPNMEGAAEAYIRYRPEEYNQLKNWLAFELYKRDAGEVQARMVQNRRMMDGFELDFWAPFGNLYMDVPWGGQIDGWRGLTQGAQPSMSMPGPSQSIIMPPRGLSLNSRPKSGLLDVYHGTTKSFEGLPKPDMNDAGLHVTRDPMVASRYAGIEMDASDPTNRSSVVGGRVFPLTVDPGNMFNGFKPKDYANEIPDTLKWTDPKEVASAIEDHHMGDVGPLLSPMVKEMKQGVPVTDAFKRNGYDSFSYLTYPNSELETFSSAPKHALTLFDEKQVMPRGLTLGSKPAIKRLGIDDRHTWREYERFLRDR